MLEKEPQFEKPLEVPGISQEDLSALQENKAFLSFVEKFKSLQQDAEQKGIDISQAINYLEKGEGSPVLVREALSKLAQKDVEGLERAAARSSRPLSDREKAEIEQKTKYGETLEDFNFFMGLPALRKKTEAKNVGLPQESPVARKTVEEILRERSEYSPEREKKAIEAREEFQKSMWDDLREYARLLQEGVERTPEVQEKIDHYIDLLEERAVGLAERYEISRYEIFKPEDHPRRYLDEEYTEGGEL